METEAARFVAFPSKVKIHGDRLGIVLGYVMRCEPVTDVEDCYTSKSAGRDELSGAASEDVCYEAHTERFVASK